MEFHVLSWPVPAEYRAMTYAEHGAVLAQAEAAQRYLPIAARHGDSVLGFGLARATPAGGEILSLFVQPAWWSRGVGTHLLAMLEEGLGRGWGCAVARVSYTTQGGSVAALERVLGKRGWSAPVAHSITWQIRPEPLAGESWMRATPWPPGHEIFPWAELRPGERAALEAARGAIDPTLWPLDDEQLHDPHSSVGLRRDGEVIGWMVTHRIAPQVIRFTALHVREPWASPRVTMRLLTEAIRRKEAHYPPSVIGLLTVRMENAAMRRLTARKFEPHAAGIWETRTAEKRLDFTPRSATAE